ncbi:MAG TPA: M20/M25/M40 family metallo-hydrolase, partial [Candidatus Limnocylindrales bacterium]
VYRLTIRGAWGHGSMPRDENAAVRAATAIVRLAEPGPPSLTPVMRRFFEQAAGRLEGRPAALVRKLLEGDVALDDVIADLCEEPYRRAARALVRDTISIGIVAAGVKYNVIPGLAEIELDCRVLPTTTEAMMRDEVRRRLGDELARHVDIELEIFGPPVESPSDHPIVGLLARTLCEHDGEAVPVPVMAPFATDAKHLVPLGVPTYGFSPLRNDPGELWLERFHGVDERVGVDALRFGLPVLYDVVRRYCG